MEPWRQGLAGANASCHRASGYAVPDLPRTTPTQLGAGQPSPATPSLTRPPISQTGATRYRNINLLSIDYAFRPRLRGRLTLRRLTLRRNPWTFGESVFHTLCRYSCQHSHFPYLHGPSQVPLHRPRERSATAHQRCTQSFGSWLEPRYIFGAGPLI